MRFVKKHPGHLKVCTWCKNSKIPKDLWKWDKTLKVWYKFSHYDKKWHYWGPSKKGFTSVGWSYYRGYWHHGGFAYKYHGGSWWRYVNRKWVKYAKTVPVTPKAPIVKKECRAFYLRMKPGFSASLAEQKLPRCKVGKEIFQWRGEADCRFIGGKLAYVTRHTCKSKHSNDQWKRVIRCVREPRATGKGLFSKGLKSLNMTKIATTNKGDGELLSSGNVWNNTKGYKDTITVRFNKPTNLDALGIKAGAGLANQNPHYVHAQIWTGKHKQDVIRKTSWKTKRVQEIRLWTGHLAGVTKVEFFLRNAKKSEKIMTVN